MVTSCCIVDSQKSLRRRRIDDRDEEKKFYRFPRVNARLQNRKLHFKCHHSMMKLGTIGYFVFALLLAKCHAYKPVFIVHGILAHNSTMVKLAEIINQYHPGTRVYVSSRYCGWGSLLPMNYQVQETGPDLLQVSELHPEGFHLIGYSQGGLLARAMLQEFPQHRVKTFISLSSPQAGQYGTEMIRIFFPHLMKKKAYELFYSRFGQRISVANYWNDPHHQALYYRYNSFLPSVNNEVNSSNISDFKTGITKLKRMVLIGGPDDGIISPWQSSQFGYYDENEDVIVMKNRSIFVDDFIGLRTLDERGALHTHTVPGIGHHFWHKNLTVIKKYILPYLT